jgi:soluble lytic murein transglycosylase
MKEYQIIDILNRPLKPDYTKLIVMCIIIIFYLIGRLTASTRAEINIYADEVADYYDIPHEIVRAIIEVESSYNIRAKSHKGAVGLMQVTEPAYKDYKRRNPSTYITNYSIVSSNWKANIAVGAWYFKRVCYNQTGNWKSAIVSYFWGVNHKSPTLVYYNKVKRSIKGS